MHDIGQERLFYVAKPMRITNPACPICHDTPERAPPARLARYGTANGFGWPLNEVVGIQLLTVPVTRQFSGLLEMTACLAGGLLMVFGRCYVSLSAALDLQLVRPLKALAAADAASVSGGHTVREPRGAASELHAIAHAIERLRISLSRAMAHLGRDDSAS